MLFAELAKALRGPDEEKRVKAAAFLEIVDRAENFEAFAESMREAVRQVRWLDAPD